MKDKTYGEMYDEYLASDPINPLSLDDWLSADCPMSDPPGLRESIAAAKAEAAAAQAAIDEEAGRPDPVQTAILAAAQSLLESQGASLTAVQAIAAAKAAQFDAAELTTRLTRAEQVIARPRPAPPVVVEQVFSREAGTEGRTSGAVQYMSDGTTRTGVIKRDDTGRPISVTWT